MPSRGAAELRLGDDPLIGFFVNFPLIDAAKIAQPVRVGYVWFPESTKERKKMLRKMIFSCLIVPWKIVKKI